MTYHSGELAVQKRAGVEVMAERVGRGIHMTMPHIAQQILEAQSFAIASSVDEQGHVWASILVGEPGFLQPIDDQTIQLNLHAPINEQVLNNLKSNPQLGLLVIDLATRQRMRVNGTVVNTPDGLILVIEQVYSNCQKFIQRRTISTTTNEPHIEIIQTDSLTDDQSTWIKEADTFFIASYHPVGGADASHRGGNPGFIHVKSSQRIEFPDYAGNMMFNTLGNIEENPKTGLLFINFSQSHVLQLTGMASIVWDDANRIAQFPGAERLVEFQVEQVQEHCSALPMYFSLEQFSPHNPAV